MDYYVIIYLFLQPGCQSSSNKLLSKIFQNYVLKVSFSLFSIDVNISEFAVIAIFSGENNKNLVSMDE